MIMGCASSLVTFSLAPSALVIFYPIKPRVAVRFAHLTLGYLLAGRWPGPCFMIMGCASSLVTFSLAPSALVIFYPIKPRVAVRFAHLALGYLLAGRWPGPLFHDNGVRFESRDIFSRAFSARDILSYQTQGCGALCAPDPGLFACRPSACEHCEGAICHVHLQCIISHAPSAHGHKYAPYNCLFRSFFKQMNK